MLLKVLRQPGISSVLNGRRSLNMDNVILVNPEAASAQGNHVESQRKPYFVELEAQKQYSYCACGHSAKQPFCDGSHKKPELNCLTPVRFKMLRNIAAATTEAVRFASHKTPGHTIPKSAPTELREAFEHYFKDVTELAKPPDSERSRISAQGAPSPVYGGVARKLGYKPRNGFQ